MAPAILILVILVCTALLLGTNYWRFTPSKQSSALGYKYGVASSNVQRVISRAQALVDWTQGSMCAAVRPLWTQAKASLPVGAVGLSCTDAKAQFAALIAADYVSYIGPDSSAKLKDNLIALFGEVLDITCVNGQIDTAKAVALMDDLLVAFC